MISSNLSCVAFAERLALFWMTNTIQKVTTVVPVLMNSCHVSEKLNSGPVTNQTTTTNTEPISAGRDPRALVRASAIRSNRAVRLGDPSANPERRSAVVVLIVRSVRGRTTALAAQIQPDTYQS